MSLQPPPADLVTVDTKTQRSRRGFAAMDPDLQREIARRGGIAVHRSGHAHRFTPSEAREAGRKGGDSVSRDSEHMARIGSRGGRSSGARKRRQTAAPQTSARGATTDTGASAFS